MNIAVVGLGAIGGWLAARLALAGLAVTGFARGATRDALREGLTLVRGDEREVALLPISDNPAAAGPQHLLLLATKATSLADAADWARPLIGRDTVIVPLQNGVPWWFLGPDRPLRSIDPDGRIAAALPFDQVLGAVVHASAARPGPAEIRLRHADRLLLGERDGVGSARLDRIVALLASAGIPAVTEPEIRRAIWYKLWGNMTVNPLSALTRVTTDRLLADPAIRAMMANAMREAAAVGAAIGCPIAEDPEARMAITTRLGAFKTSMLQDLEAGRPLELDALIGAPREIARQHGIAMPTIDLIDALARELAGSMGLIPSPPL